MSSNEALSRSDRVLVVALGIVLATASAALGSAMNHRSNVQVVRIPVTAPAPAPAPQADPDLVLTQLIAEHQCLTQALYYEARGEGRTGEQAVAEVVFHRINAGHFGHSICAVVYAGSGHPGCQFSFTCNGDLHRPREETAWKKAEELAAKILTGEVALHNTTGGAIYYHASWVSPDWAPAMKRTAQIGNHIFYRSGVHTSAS